MFSPGQKERETSLGLGSLLVDLQGMEWPLDKPGKSRTFVLLLVHLSCVEVRMTLEDLTPAQVGDTAVGDVSSSGCPEDRSLKSCS